MTEITDRADDVLITYTVDGQEKAISVTGASLSHVENNVEAIINAHS
jgi:hypothetical protein